MKLQFNLVSKIIISIMASSGALLCSFATNAIEVTHEGMKLKGATLAEPKPNTSLPSEKPIAPNQQPKNNKSVGGHTNIVTPIPVTLKAPSDPKNPGDLPIPTPPRAIAEGDSQAIYVPVNNLPIK